MDNKNNQNIKTPKWSKIKSDQEIYLTKDDSDITILSTADNQDDTIIDSTIEKLEKLKTASGNVGGGKSAADILSKSRESTNKINVSQLLDKMYKDNKSKGFNLNNRTQSIKNEQSMLDLVILMSNFDGNSLPVDTTAEEEYRRRKLEEEARLREEAARRAEEERRRREEMAAAMEEQEISIVNEAEEPIPEPTPEPEPEPEEEIKFEPAEEVEPKKKDPYEDIGEDNSNATDIEFDGEESRTYSLEELKKKFHISEDTLVE